MPRFAHISDSHIGAFRQPVLQNLTLTSFEKALDICVQKGVDFIIVCGDLFDSNIPDMGIVSKAARKLKQVKDTGIRIYTVYGSHDFSPTGTSIVDVLENAGLFKKVTDHEINQGKIRLHFTIDEPTGAKLCGIPGRKAGIDREFYKRLDTESLEKEEGFKIFNFHAAINEFTPTYLPGIEAVPLDSLPEGFSYYAAGHLHEKAVHRLPRGASLVYPGTLFGSEYRDLEKSSRGEERGFYIVDFDSKVSLLEFFPVKCCDYLQHSLDAEGKPARKVMEGLLSLADSLEAENRLILLRVHGELSSGRTSEIEFHRVRRRLEERGALHVLINHNQLTSHDYSTTVVQGEDTREIERTLFASSISQVKTKVPSLSGTSGTELSLRLLDIVRNDQKPNEPKRGYEERISRDSFELLKLTEHLQ